MENNTREEVEIDIIELLHVLKAKWIPILLAAIIFASAAGFGTHFLMTPMYKSKAQLFILSKSTSLTSLADIQIGTQLTQDYMILIKSRPVVNKVIENLELNLTYNQLVKTISVNNPASTRILEIYVEYDDPYLAKRIVDEVAAVSRQRIASIMDAEEPTLVDEGNLPETTSSPSLKRNVVIGFALGVIAAMGVIVVLYLLDDTIKDTEDVVKYLGLTTLGLIPVEEGMGYKITRDRKKRNRSFKVHSKKVKRA